jgi:hypothetical protein
VVPQALSPANLNLITNAISKPDGRGQWQWWWWGRRFRLPT